LLCIVKEEKVQTSVILPFEYSKIVWQNLVSGGRFTILEFAARKRARNGSVVQFLIYEPAPLYYTVRAFIFCSIGRTGTAICTWLLACGKFRVAKVHKYSFLLDACSASW
jgi:hypothetical protein